MTDIARKRAFTQITKDNVAKPKVAEKPIKKQKKAEKVINEEKAPAAKDNDDDKYAFDGTLSLYHIAISQPSRLKSLLDHSLQSDTTASFLKTVFLYFFELMGV